MSRARLFCTPASNFQVVSISRTLSIIYSRPQRCSDEECATIDVQSAISLHNKNRRRWTIIRPRAIINVLMRMKKSHWLSLSLSFSSFLSLFFSLRKELIELVT